MARCSISPCGNCVGTAQEPAGDPEAEAAAQVRGDAGRAVFDAVRS